MAPTHADGAAGGAAFRYHRWRDTVIRERNVRDVEALTARGWAYSPYALDALTGMGEDPYSCGEWADQVTEAEAEEIARAQGLSLTGERMDPTEQSQSAPDRRQPSSAGRWLPRWARRRLL